MTRREAREQAMCFVFEQLFVKSPLSEITALAREARVIDTEAAARTDALPVFEMAPDPFAERLAGGVFVHLPEIDARIEKYSIGWSRERLSRVALAILRLTVYEIQFEPDIPIGASINEAVELAKKYGGDGDAPFINGVLGALARAEHPEDATGAGIHSEGRKPGKRARPAKLETPAPEDTAQPEEPPAPENAAAPDGPEV